MSFTRQAAAAKAENEEARQRAKAEAAAQAERKAVERQRAAELEAMQRAQREMEVAERRLKAEKQRQEAEKARAIEDARRRREDEEREAATSGLRVFLGSSELAMREQAKAKASILPEWCLLFLLRFTLQSRTLLAYPCPIHADMYTLPPSPPQPNPTTLPETPSPTTHPSLRRRS